MQGTSVFLRLTLGVEHQHVPGAIRAAPTARILWNIGSEQIVLAGYLLGPLQTALLRLKTKLFFL